MTSHPTPPDKVNPFPRSIGLYPHKTYEEGLTYRPLTSRLVDFLDRIFSRKRPPAESDGEQAR
jgi:hypothetical protein